MPKLERNTSLGLLGQTKQTKRLVSLDLSQMCFSSFSHLSGAGCLILCQLPSSSFSSSASSFASSSTASSGWQCSLPDLNRKFRMPAFPAGPQPRVPRGSVCRRTSTASFRLAVFPAGPQPPAPDHKGQIEGPQWPAPDRSGCRRTSPDRMSEFMSARRSDYMPMSACTPR